MAELLACLPGIETRCFERAGAVQRLPAVNRRGLAEERLRQDEAQELAVKRGVQVEGGPAEIVAAIVVRFIGTGGGLARVDLVAGYHFAVLFPRRVRRRRFYHKRLRRGAAGRLNTADSDSAAFHPACDRRGSSALPRTARAGSAAA